MKEKVPEEPQKEPARPEIGLYNPLRLGLLDIVELCSEEVGTYEVYQITEYTTQLSDASYRSTRYFLRDSSAIDEFEPLAIELMKARDGRPPVPYLLHLVEEFSYDEDFLKLLEDDIFVISEETEEEEIIKEYEKSCRVSSGAITLDETRRISKDAVAVWNYELEDELETLYLFVEISRQDGWTTIYEGQRLPAAEVGIYQRLTQGGE